MSGRQAEKGTGEKQISKEIKTWGYPEQCVSVELDMEKIALYKIPLNRILGALQSENINIPAGSIDINT
jgi:multidrug efflux pump subunit AcrB